MKIPVWLLCLIIAFALGIAVVSFERQVNKEMHNRPTKTVKDQGFIGWTHVTVEGHQYIVWTRVTSSGMVHDPDCSCLKPAEGE